MRLLAIAVPKLSPSGLHSSYLYALLVLSEGPPSTWTVKNY